MQNLHNRREVVLDFYPATERVYVSHYPDSIDRRVYYQESAEVMELLCNCAVMLCATTHKDGQLKPDSRVTKMVTDLKALRLESDPAWTQEEILQFVMFQIRATETHVQDSQPQEWGAKRRAKKPRPSHRPTTAPVQRRLDMASLLQSLNEFS